MSHSRGYATPTTHALLPIQQHQLVPIDTLRGNPVLSHNMGFPTGSITLQGNQLQSQSRGIAQERTIPYRTVRVRSFFPEHCEIAKK